MNFELMIESLPVLWDGFILTLELFALTTVLSSILALFVGILRVSKNGYVRIPIAWTIRLLRGTPLLVQLFIIYFGLAQLDFVRHSWAWPFLRQPFWCALIAFVLNSAAYNAHILRGAILSVPHGEVEAAKAFGMSQYAIYRYVILPSAFRIGLPAFGNEMIKNMKRTAIASTITIGELTGTANLLVARTLAPYEIFLTAAAFYLVLAFVITQAVKRVEAWIRIPAEPLHRTSAPLATSAVA